MKPVMAMAVLAQPVPFIVGDIGGSRFGPPLLREGIWLDQFEGQRFFEHVRRVREVDFCAPRVWLDLDDGFSDAQARVRRREGTRTGNFYRVRFIGRIAEPRRQGFGHFGMSQGYVRGERILSIRYLGQAPEGQGVNCQPRRRF